MTIDQLIKTLENYKKMSELGGETQVGIATDVDWPGFRLITRFDTYYFEKYLTEPLLLLIADEK